MFLFDAKIVLIAIYTNSMISVRNYVIELTVQIFETYIRTVVVQKMASLLNVHYVRKVFENTITNKA